jgi:parallel beta-helix repeat protein
VRIRRLAVTAAVGGSLALAGMAAPGWAAPAKYPGQGKCPAGGYKLCINGGPGGFTISGRTFSGGPNAILLRDVSNVTIERNTFKNLKGKTGYAGVHVKNSSGIRIRNNSFTSLSNKGHMHGVYLVKTSRSTISGNTFSAISGDPVRIRDGSSGNTVSGNTFRKSGIYASFSEWRDTRKGEVCGSGNVFRNNRYGPGPRGRHLPTVKWGGKGGGTSGIKLSWGNCRKASIVDKGGNKRL